MKKMMLSLLALGMFAGYSFAAEVDAVEVADLEIVDAEYVVEDEFYKNLNGALEAFRLPEGLTTFAEVYELVAKELQKTAEEKPELLKGMVEKYGQETADGEKVVLVPLNFYIKG